MVAKILLAAALITVSASAHAEDCVAGWTNSSGDTETKRVVIDLASAGKLDPAALPESTSSISCPRPSIVPLPDDIRVLIELNIAFAVTDETGRSLWIYAEEGSIKTMVDDGELNPAETAAVNDWTRVAQARFDAALAARTD